MNRVLKAFTLVELLVVVAIIAILAAVAIPAYNNYTTKSKFAEVVLATGPTKTAETLCIMSGDCVSNGEITVPTGGNLVVADPAPLDQSTEAIAALLIAQGSEITDFSGDLPFYVWPLDNGLPMTPESALSNAGTLSTDFSAQVVESATFPGYVCMTGSMGCLPDQLSANKGTTLDQLIAAGLLVKRADYNASYATLSGNSTTASTALSCAGPQNGCSPSSKYVASVANDVSGVITATAVSSSGLNGETFLLMPSYSGGRVDWAASGSCKTRAGGALC